MRSPRPPRPWPVKPEPPESRRPATRPAGRALRCRALGSTSVLASALRHESSHPPDGGRDGGRPESSHARRWTRWRPSRIVSPPDGRRVATVTNRLTARAVHASRRSPDAPTPVTEHDVPTPTSTGRPTSTDSIPSTPTPTIDVPTPTSTSRQRPTRSETIRDASRTRPGGVRDDSGRRGAIRPRSSRRFGTC